MPNFKVRDTTPELMDTEACTYEDFRSCLEQLAQVNWLTFAYRPTIAFFDELLRARQFDLSRPLSIVDIGSGYGDVLRQVDRWAEQRQVMVDLQGVDINPWAARAAAEATPPDRPIRWITDDLFNYRPNGGVDIIISSLFTHHLNDAKLVRFVRWMENQSRIGWMVNDLQRHPIPYYAVKYAFRATLRHRFMQHDGPVSIASAFLRSDWSGYARAAGLPSDTLSIQAWVPFRLRISRVKRLERAT